MSLELHRDPAWFQAALQYTSRETGFRMDLVEKDYYCSVVLEHLFQASTELVFKGGTSLNKVHLGFYRLSEDLDFSIPISSKASREERSAAIKPYKQVLTEMVRLVPEVRLKKDLTGSNESRQYNAELEYTSASTGATGTIKVEVGLRELLLEPHQNLPAHTLLKEPFSGADAVSPVQVQCLSRDEAYAEKVRAALTRRQPAIRDWFDLDHAETQASFDFARSRFLNLVQKKLSVPGSELPDERNSRNEQLRLQINTELRPVLRDEDFSNFDLERAIATVDRIRARL